MRSAPVWLVCAAIGCGPKAGEQLVPSPPPEDSADDEFAVPPSFPKRPGDPSAPPSKAPDSATRTASGVEIEWLTRGDPEAKPPRRGERLHVHFRVWNEHGTRIAASVEGKTETLETAWLPPGWAEAMLKLRPGDHAQIWVPAALAYPSEPDAPQGPLRIEVELVDVERIEAVAHADVPLLAPPPTALRTASGIAFAILREGTGTRHPDPNGKVTVHYEGWTTDGNQFDSSYKRGRPATFPLNAVIAGWQEAVPLMVEGEKTRFWIPAELAYGSSPGKPQGMLIFDVELIRIEG